MRKTYGQHGGVWLTEACNIKSFRTLSVTFPWHTLCTCWRRVDHCTPPRNGEHTNDRFCTHGLVGASSTTNDPFISINTGWHVACKVPWKVSRTACSCANVGANATYIVQPQGHRKIRCNGEPLLPTSCVQKGEESLSWRCWATCFG